MLHAGLAKKRRDDADDGEPETKEERKQRKEEEKEAKHEEQKAKNKERKRKLKKNTKKGAKTAAKGAKFLPLILEPYRIEECETCGLDAYVPLGAKTKAEKEAKKKAKKAKGISKKQRQKELKEKKKKEAEEARERRRAAAAEQERAQERAVNEAKLARQFRMGMNQLAQDSRRALNDEIDAQFHALQRGRLEQLDVLVQAADARRALIVRLLHFHERFVVEFNAVPDMTQQVAVKKTMGISAGDYQAAVVDQLQDLLVALNKFVPPQLATDEAQTQTQENVNAVARKIEDITLYLLRRTEEQRTMVETFDGAIVELNAQILDFPEVRGFERFATYIAQLNRVYAFIFAYTLDEFLQGLVRAHNITNPEARRRELARRQREQVLKDDETEESDSYSITEEESAYDTSEEEESGEEEDDGMQPEGGGEPRRPRRERRARLPRVAKDRLTVREKRTAIMAPILFDLRGMKQFFNMEMTNYMIELVRLVAELPALLEMSQMLEFYTVIEVFQFTTFVLGAQYDAQRNPGDWQPYYLEDMVEETYMAMLAAIAEKKQEDKKESRQRSKKKKADEAQEEARSVDEEGDEEVSLSVDEDSTGESGDDDIEVEQATQQPQKPVKEKRLKDKEAIEKRDSLVGDPALVRGFAATLFKIVNGSNDRTAERAAWDPQRDARKKQEFKKQALKMQVQLIEQTRGILRVYGNNAKAYSSRVDSVVLKTMIDAAHLYIDQQAAKGQKVVLKPADKKEVVEGMSVEGGGGSDDENTTAASSTTPKKSAAKKPVAKKGKKSGDDEEEGAAKSGADSAVEKLRQKIPQLLDHAQMYHRITVALAVLLADLQILPGYVLQKQDPFLRWDAQGDVEEEEEEESSEEQVDLDDETYKRSRQLVLRDDDDEI